MYDSNKDNITIDEIELNDSNELCNDIKNIIEYGLDDLLNYRNTFVNPNTSINQTNLELFMHIVFDINKIIPTNTTENIIFMMDNQLQFNSETFTININPPENTGSGLDKKNSYTITLVNRDNVVPKRFEIEDLYSCYEENFKNLNNVLKSYIEYGKVFHKDSEDNPIYTIKIYTTKIHDERYDELIGINNAKINPSLKNFYKIKKIINTYFDTLLEEDKSLFINILFGVNNDHKNNMYQRIIMSNGKIDKLYIICKKNDKYIDIVNDKEYIKKINNSNKIYDTDIQINYNNLEKYIEENGSSFDDIFYSLVTTSLG